MVAAEDPGAVAEDEVAVLVDVAAEVFVFDGFGLEGEEDGPVGYRGLVRTVDLEAVGAGG